MLELISEGIRKKVNEITEVYFVRHAQPEKIFSIDRMRALSSIGLEDSRRVTDILLPLGIDVFVSSPYLRSLQTISHAAESMGKEIETYEGFCERTAGPGGHDEFYRKKRWEDFDFHEKGGEPLALVQKRNIEALNMILDKYNGKKIAVGTHGTALSTIINYYDNTFLNDEFMKILEWLPYIIRLDFDGREYIKREDIFHIHRGYPV